VGDGVLFALGDLHGGLALFVADGRLHGALAAPETTTELVSPEKVPAGSTTLALLYDPSDGGTLALSIDGEVVATAPHRGPIPATFQHGGAHLRIGYDVDQPVSPAYEAPGHLDGEVFRVVIDASAETNASMADLVRAALHAD
jgi:arylsulfatase